VDWIFVGGATAALSLLAGRGLYRRAHQDAAAKSSGLTAAADLTHLPTTLQQTALWALADGGFEQRVVHGAVSRASHDIEVTAFDLETLRERRGEWAWLPVEPPFRIGPVVSVVVCEVDRAFPHALFKHVGVGDELRDDNVVDRSSHVAKLARDGLGLGRSYASELPVSLPPERAALALPDGWRGYTHAADAYANIAPALAAAHRRDLVVELLDALIVVYPAAREVVGSDAFADLTTTALAVTEGVLAAIPKLSPRGIEP
jgi:hypothetical protein